MGKRCGREDGTTPRGQEGPLPQPQLAVPVQATRLTGLVRVVGVVGEKQTRGWVWTCVFRNTK